MQTPAPKLFPVYLMLLFVAVVWGANLVLMKITFGVMSPLAFNGVRMALALAVLLGFLLIREGWQPIPMNDALKLAGLGLVGNAAFQVFIISGLNLTRPENAALIQATIPVWAALLAGLAGWEKITPRLWTGIILSFAGVALVIYSTSGGLSLDSGSAILGDLLVLASAISWAIYTVSSKDLLQRYSPLRVSTLALCAGLPVIWIFTLPAVFSTHWDEVPLGAWGSIIFSGTFSIAINYILWSTAVLKVGAARTAVFQNISPVITFITAYFVIQEPIFLLQLAGGVVVLLGVWITIRQR
ncbi:DMT family transporter [Candidatus Acetothermia bacterium]|nr:DMT family transporter [Candidatus Acetothermia bacterium]MBI3642909.1 DMT family transporter [Candidatus Acetothermia bacterium]